MRCDDYQSVSVVVELDLHSKENRKSLLRGMSANGPGENYPHSLYKS